MNIAHLEQWVGKTETRADQITPTPLAALSDLTRATSEVHVETLSVENEDATSATVSAGIRTVARDGGQPLSSQVRWRLVKQSGQWQLADQMN